MSYCGGKHGMHSDFTTRKSSKMNCLANSKSRTSHSLLSARSSSLDPSIRSTTASIRTSNAFLFHSFGRPGGMKPVCLCCCNANRSAFSSRSIKRNAVTITVGSLRTVARVRFIINRIFRSNCCETTSTFSKYRFSVILS